MGASRSFDASESDIVPSTFDVPQVPKELLVDTKGQVLDEMVVKEPDGPTAYLDPQRTPLSDSCKLSRLEVSEAKSRKVSILLRKF